MGPKTAPQTEKLLFDCSDVGTQSIEFWATDEAGNSDYCQTFITIQDLDQSCAPIVSNAMIAGGVLTEMGSTVEDVTISINGTTQQAVTTNQEGHFELRGLPMGGDYTIVPERGGEANNGVSTIDLILISQHILGVKRLDSPYKIIAADVNRSKSVTTLDLIELRKIILRIKTNMPKDGLPWRFVPASFEFEDPQNPFKRNFPEVYNVNDLEWENLTANFVAIKIGDVNNSAVANRKGIVQNRADLGKWEIVVQDQEFKSGSNYTIDFIGKNTEMVSGYQFTLDFDPDKLEVLEVIPGDFPNMTMDHFGLQAKKDGLITTSWTKSDDGILREEAVIFSVECKAKEDSRAGDVLALNSKLTEKEAYDYNLEKMSIHLVFDQESIQDQIAPQNFALEVYQNRPNPFYDRTSIPFDLSNSGQVEFKVFDAMGKVLLQKSDQFNSGRNQIEITKEELNGTGIFYYQIETAGKRTIKKMIVN